MSRFSAPPPRTLFASKTNFDALAVDSGEDTEDDENVSEDTTPENLVEQPTKLTKSAIKKANRLARLERKQRQKSKTQPQAHEGITEIVTDPPPVSAPVAPAIHIQDISLESPLQNVDGPSSFSPPPVVTPREQEKSFVSCPPMESERSEPDSSSNSESPSLTQVRPLVATLESPIHGVSEKTSLPDLSPPAQPNVQDSEKTKKRQILLTRTLWTFIMIGGFVGLLLLGHAYMVLLVMLCQTLVYREVTALFSLKSAAPESRDKEDLKGKDPWSKTLNWYFFAVTNYFLYGESIIYYFKHVVFADAQLLPFATNHRMISFTLYTIGFMGFVMSLKKGYLKQQFGLFCWVHMSLLLIVMSSHFIVNNILEGLIWFWVPASLVICNDCFAYIWGVTLGRTPLIKLSPKKTVEGFVGAFWSTVIFAVIWGTYFMQFNYMICPVHDLGVSAWSSMQCVPNPVFVWKNLELWRPLATLLTWVMGRVVLTIPYAPYQLHLLLLAFFASLVAPFGGFFASGFKRAFNIKDFGHSIPGHGGMTDRMDCQFLMGVFTYVYYSSLIRQNNVTVGGILQTIVSGLTVEQQLELIADLTRYLGSQGISVT
ncbi:hypothetical protein K443DRAFT_678405 [Laccaria amethystina LaAM-08-1]|uniref:Phosphatidate cytidylyltransferase n=1 Tax=Laccaria amethystina LaAM-08-1 TaxID=1095629 RepID=A0A0C9XUU4_9AGAR|nr:hypothetical protein K443DRAFT_678405 [Laccaria amethystina LaAM-08-1]